MLTMLFLIVSPLQVALKLASPTEEHLGKHYADLKDKPFFPKLGKFSPSLLSLELYLRRDQRALGSCR